MRAGPIAASAAPGSTELAPAQRVEVFERIWTEIDKQYYDPHMNGADWPAARGQYRSIVDTISTDRSFYAAMTRMVGLLHDAHTRVFPPTAAALRAGQEAANVGLTVRALDGRATVVAVRTGSPAARAGIEPGMLVPTINGVNSLARVAALAAALPEVGRPGTNAWRACNQAFVGQRDSTMHLTVERAEGSTFEAALNAELVSTAPEVESRLLPSGNAYIRWTSFWSPVEKTVPAAVARLKDAPGMILDLRGNPGGNHTQQEVILRLFLDRETPVYQIVQRRGATQSKPEPFINGSAGGAVSRGPVVILLNEQSGSASELFSSAMQETGRAKVAGVETCGCVLGINGYLKLPGGGELSIAWQSFLTMHGEKLEGRGVIPNIRAVPTLADLRARRDVALEAADQWLRDGARARRSQ